MTIDQQEARAIAFLAARRRKQTHGCTEWDEAGIVASLAKVAHMDLAEVVIATMRAASNPAAQTPGVIPQTGGEHWREKLAEPKRYHPPKRGEDCPHHPGQYADRCGGCAADQATHTPAPPQQHHVNPDADRARRGAAAARAALRAATTVQEDS